MMILRVILRRMLLIDGRIFGLYRNGIYVICRKASIVVVILLIIITGDHSK